MNTVQLWLMFAFGVATGINITVIIQTLGRNR